ncbi:MAG: hypothetical protein DRI57_31250 [Deltaproteobacteria bacterium]|nr:MAG: hypothetical protein DRI57_31250 [Deltaproteobacteria bacterium]
MQAMREYAIVRNGPKYGAEVRSAFSEKKTRRLGILKGKADCVIKDNFKLTDEEFLGNEIPA